MSTRHEPTPSSNSAVDGYAFAGPLTEVPCTLPLVDGRSAAGEPYRDRVPAGHAIRILTGAVMPAGTDTVVLEEDCEVIDGQLHLNGTLKAGANRRLAGEDIQAQDRILSAGTRLTPTQISVLASVGVESVDVYQRLRVGVLSTGDEVKPVGSPVTDWQIYDANRPMLSALVTQLGYELVDLGHALDRAEDVTAALERGAEQCDLILTSGGVSAGDEDHVSKTLKAHGEISNWRIAIKPGRRWRWPCSKARPWWGYRAIPLLPGCVRCALLRRRWRCWQGLNGSNLRAISYRPTFPRTRNRDAARCCGPGSVMGRLRYSVRKARAGSPAWPGPRGWWSWTRVPGRSSREPRCGSFPTAASGCNQSTLPCTAKASSEASCGALER